MFKDIILLLIREYSSAILNSNVPVSLSSLANKFGMSEEYLDNILTQLFNSGIIDYSKPLLHKSVRLKVPRLEDRFLKLDYKQISQIYELSLKRLDKVVEYVYSGDCRMKFIINYFGEKEKDFRCGKCDNCEGKDTFPKGNLEYFSELFIRTIAEGKGEIREQRILNILLGKIGKEYSTYGSCANYSEDELRTILEELVSKNIISKKSAGKIIRIGDKGNKILKELGISIFSKTKQEFDYEDNLTLFNKLREVRDKAAAKFLQTNYLICPDEILRKAAETKPVTMQQLLSIKGFNQRMFNKMGEEFLEVIKEHLNEKEQEADAGRKIPSNIYETYNLVAQGYSLADIASLRKLTESVLSMQIETILEYYPQTDISNLFSKEIIDAIKSEINKGYKDLKELRERLPDYIGYPQIRIVLAKSISNK